MQAAPPNKQSRKIDDSKVNPRPDKRHRLQKGRRVNVPLLMSSAAVLICLSAVGYFWHQRQEAKLFTALKQRADALAEKKEWGPAAGYWQRYLWLAPDDFEARLNLLDAIEHRAVTPRDRRQLSLMLREAIGLAPEEKDRLALRVRVAENLFEMGDYRGAYFAAESLLEPNPGELGIEIASDDAAELERICALSGCVLARDERDVKASVEAADRARNRGEITIQDAADYLLASTAKFPGDTRLATSASYFFREHDTAANGPLPVGRADEFMNALLASRPNDADALIARYSYRKRYPVPGVDADADLTAALQLQPNHYEGLILKAGVVAVTDLNSARALVKKAIETKPEDKRGYIALAQLEATKGNWDAAATVLQEARGVIGRQDLAINNMLTYVLIRANKLAVAEDTLKDLDGAIQSQLAELSVESRRSLQDQLQLLRAQLAVADGDLHRAAIFLKAIVAGSEQAPAGQEMQVTVEAKELLANVVERLGYWELAAGYWMDLTAVPSKTGEATRRAAAASLASGQLDRAIQLADQYFHPPLAPSGGDLAWKPAPEACLLLLQANLQKQLALPIEERSWTEFESALALSNNLAPPRVEACLAEFEYQRSLGGDEAKGKAKRALAAGERVFVDQAAFWRAAALGYQSLDQHDDVQRALARFDALESNSAVRVALHAVVASRDNDFDDAEKLLSDAIVAADDNERVGLQLLRVNLLIGAGSADRALQILKEAIKPTDKDVRLLVTGIETALRAKDYAAAQEWEVLLASANPSDDFTARYYRARRLLDQFEKLSPKERESAEQLVSDLRTVRPNWSESVALAARIADLQGNTKQAIDEYQLAISLGNKNPAVLERLVAMAYAEGRYDLAEAYIAQLPTDSQSHAEMESLAIATALRRNQFADAIALGRKAVESHPDDPVRQIWLANLLAQDAISRGQQPDEAEKALGATRAKFPDDVRVWSALFSLLQRSKQIEKAKQLLEEFAADPGKETWDGHFVAAQAYQSLGENERAIQEADAATKLQPSNVASRQLLAKLLMSTDVVRAAKEFRFILSLPGDHGEARRQLAILLSTSGSDADWREAMQLLESNTGGEATVEGVADNRLRAALLSRQGKNQGERAKNLTAARKILEELIEKRGAAADDVDRLLLAKVCEQEAALVNELPLLQAAREQFQYLVNRAGAPISYTLEYTDFLLRQLARSTDSEEGATLKEVFIEDAKGRIADMEHETQQEGTLIDALQILGCRARLQRATGQEESATKAITDFIDKRLPAMETEIGQTRAWLAVANLYSSIGQHVEAEKWYRRLTTVAPESYVLLVRELVAQGRTEDAIAACLEASPSSSSDSPRGATVLAQLISSASANSDGTKRVEPVISAALKAHGNDVDLLMAVAVLNVTRKNDAEAIRYFRRVVELAPKNALALNNLATLLAEQADQRVEALELVTRAIEANGRQPALLDTLGTIQIRSGQLAPAIASLEEAVAGGEGDPRYYFHLAAAYQRAKKIVEAQGALARARQLGLAKAILTQGDQELLQELEKQFGPITLPPQLESRTSGNPADVSARNGISSLATAG